LTELSSEEKGAIADWHLTYVERRERFLELPQEPKPSGATLVRWTNRVCLDLTKDSDLALAILQASVSGPEGWSIAIEGHLPRVVGKKINDLDCRHLLDDKRMADAAIERLLTRFRSYYEVARRPSRKLRTVFKRGVYNRCSQNPDKSLAEEAFDVYGLLPSFMED
jgi:hypothetical protein